VPDKKEETSPQTPQKSPVEDEAFSDVSSEGGSKKASKSKVKPKTKDDAIDRQMDDLEEFISVRRASESSSQPGSEAGGSSPSRRLSGGRQSQLGSPLQKAKSDDQEPDGSLWGRVASGFSNRVRQIAHIEQEECPQDAFQRRHSNSFVASQQRRMSTDSRVSNADGRSPQGRAPVGRRSMIEEEPDEEMPGIIPSQEVPKMG